MGTTPCYHCGDDCGSYKIEFDDKAFCCHGCKTVYEIFRSNNLSYYYDLQPGAGTTPKEVKGKYDFLDNPDIAERLIEFQDDHLKIVSLQIPDIHCSSCIWVLENLHKLLPAVISAQVDFPRKKVQISYRSDRLQLKDLVILLSRIGYEPHISLEEYEKDQSPKDRSLIYKVGVAGFAFGNVMFLSFPEYFNITSEVGLEEFWLEQYKGLFRWIMFAFSLPVVFYAASGYFISAYKGLRSGLLNIDVPIALGIVVLFLRSTADIALDLGSGFFDSLTGLVFFLLLGKLFQQKTYSFLSFERDYKSYFPMAVTRIATDGSESAIPVYEIKKGDRLLIRNQEIIPVDGILKKGNGQIDYSFVTGESHSSYRKPGDKLYAGGKQLNGVLELEVLKTVSQSYLTKLWGNKVFKKSKSSRFQTLTDSLGKSFTAAVLTIAAVAGTYWMLTDPGKAAHVFTAVLIIACPCAIALSAPFTLGNMLRIFGRRKFYLKDASTIERLAAVDTAIFDKTGTITSTTDSRVHYEGLELSPEEESLLKNTLRASNHPLSRILYDILAEQDIYTLDNFDEKVGKGILGSKDTQQIKVGSASFVGNEGEEGDGNTSVHVSSNDLYKGCFVVQNVYREGVTALMEELNKELDLAILSGDNDSERERLQTILPKLTPLFFNQSPQDKLDFVQELQDKDKHVLMVGDGLNDSGALMQSDVGIAISENINVFSPACDGILQASKLGQLSQYIKASKKAVTIIKWSFILSLLYNVVGLYFAVTAQLEPVVAAILMPLSSISIVGFTTLATNLTNRKLI